MTPLRMAVMTGAAAAVVALCLCNIATATFDDWHLEVMIQLEGR